MDPNTAPAVPAEIESPVADAPAPTTAALAPGKVFIAFAYMAKDGNGAPVQRQGRTFLSGHPDLFLQAHVEAVETMIAESLGVEQPQITFFRPLIA